MSRRLRTLLLRTAAGLALAAGAYETALRLTPMPRSLEGEWVGSPEFVDRTGKPLRLMLVDNRRFSRTCELSEVSPRMIAATLSAEDRRFRSHCGVDVIAIGRAALSAVRGERPSSGASTITQQLVKLANPGPRTIGRKLSEMWLALRVERAWGKDRILSEYLNRLDYGNLQVGVASASRYYFGKPASDLSAAESAYLAGLPKAPTRLNPRINPDGARQRQQWVLGRMLRTRQLDSDEYARAAAEPLHFAPPRREFEAPHFVDLLLQRKGVLPSQGGAVRTTLDLELNRMVEQSLNEQLRRIVDKHATGGAAVVIHNPTGEVLASAGAGDYFETGAGQVNGAWMVRSPGSAVKPFTYLLAIEKGANPCTVVPDVPTDFPTESGLYRPNNYNHRFYGPVSLRFALGNSLNVAAIRALELGGGPEALLRRLQSFGITTLDHSPEYYGLGLTLGNGEVRLLELANAFAALGRLGVYRPYRLLLREDSAATGKRRFGDARAAFLVADMLADNSARAASFGLESYLAFDFPVACKTGTSSDYRDNWAVGYTPEFTVAVWVGNPDGSPMRGITGVTGAAPVLHDVFVHLRTQRGTSWFARPAGIRDFHVHPLTGRVVNADRPGAVQEKCLWDPEAERASDYTTAGQAVLPPEYSAWLASPQNTLGDLAVCSATAPALRILQPAPNAVYFADPDLPGEAQWIPLSAEAPGAVEWTCSSLPLDTRGKRPRVQLRPGRHVISARDSSSGRVAETAIEVKEL